MRIFVYTVQVALTPPHIDKQYPIGYRATNWQVRDGEINAVTYPFDGTIVRNNAFPKRIKFLYCQVFMSQRCLCKLCQLWGGDKPGYAYCHLFSRWLGSDVPPPIVRNARHRRGA